MSEPASSPSSDAIAVRHGVPAEAVATLKEALRRGGGRQAQFTHPALGGMGQWSRGGGTMIGDMFDRDLKARVERLCDELSEEIDAEAEKLGRTEGTAEWWPADLGTPSCVGAQNDAAYAFFPQKRRLLIRTTSGLEAFDTGDQRITGASQQQAGSGASDLVFVSERGRVRLDDLAPVQVPAARDDLARRAASSRPEMPDRQPPDPSRPAGDILGLLERLHELQRKGVLTEEEFRDKKSELLARL